MDFLSEAFKSLQSLTEETFDLSQANGQEELKDFIDGDDEIDTLTIIDDEAKTDDELKDSYLGKVILDCNVCHSLIYKDPAEVVIDEDGENCNIEDECPYCYSTGDGYKLIGQIKPFGEVEKELEDEESEEEIKDEESVEVDDDFEDEDFDEDEEIIEDDDFEESFKGVIGGKSLEEAKKVGCDKKLKEDSDVCPECGKNPCECEESLNESKYVLIDELNRFPAKDQTKFISELDNNNVVATVNTIDGIQDEILSKFDVYEVDLKDDVEGILSKTLKKPHNVLFVGKPGQGIYSRIRSWLTMHDKNLQVASPNRFDETDLGGAVAPMKESIQDMSLTTDDGTTMEMTSGENGEVTIKTKPGCTQCEEIEDDVEIEPNSDDETIGEVDDEVMDEIETNTEDETQEDEMTEFDEKSFEEMGESYLKKTYSNVESFNVSDVTEKHDKLFVEGLIKFNSGNVKKTNFVFESLGKNNKGKIVFEGFNKEITGSNKAFRLIGEVNNNTFLSESLNYRYNQNNQMIKGKITK